MEKTVMDVPPWWKFQLVIIMITTKHLRII